MLNELFARFDSLSEVKAFNTHTLLTKNNLEFNLKKKLFRNKIDKAFNKCSL